MHAGWADTPGVSESLPQFYKLTKPLLGTPAQGADTIVWLCATSDIPKESDERLHWLYGEWEKVNALLRNPTETS